MAQRHSQIVSTKSQRKLVIEWMTNEVNQSGSEREISLKAVDRFPAVFKVINARIRKCCILNVYRCHNGRHAFLSALQTKENKQMVVSTQNTSGIITKRMDVKGFAGRGRKRRNWVEYLHSILLVEFNRYSSTDVQLSRSLIQSIAVELLQEPDSPFAADEADSV